MVKSRLLTSLCSLQVVFQHLYNRQYINSVTFIFIKFQFKTEWHQKQHYNSYFEVVSALIVFFMFFQFTWTKRTYEYLITLGCRHHQYLRSFSFSHFNRFLGWSLTFYSIFISLENWNRAASALILFDCLKVQKCSQKPHVYCKSKMVTTKGKKIYILLYWKNI